MNEQTTISGPKKPSSVLDLMPAIVTLGATNDADAVGGRGAIRGAHVGRDR